ncbi:MAG: SGNH/GDSL hydrolase family protein [Clostridia bacterium]|jgi:lysophospholipase L1-like esterase|nr:SGNH/GDSL hydrolase family protein [Clostridia bacterium]MBT7122956.1 SGNH/GDSL hydrolase family protein [Clostridia bacterium]
MKTVLCYGDSNTWGYRADNAERFDRDVRWTGVMSVILGDGFAVIEEGLNGRTTVFDDPIEGHKNGETYLTPCLDTHAPIDLVVIMLGTNDLKIRFSLCAYDIAGGMEKLIRIIKASESGIGHAPPKILLMSPAPVGKLTDFAEMLEGAVEKSQGLKRYYQDIAERYECAFFDIGSVAKSTDIDGIHFDEAAHKAIGQSVAKIVQEVLK